MDESLIINTEQIEKAVTALQEYTSKKQDKSLSATFEPEKINIQIGFKKVPRVKNAKIKIQLPNSLVRSNTDICLFVKDQDKNERDYEPTVEHFKELLSSKGVDNIAEVMPLKQLKLEYGPYEAKRNLSNMFDMYLADDRILRLLPPFLGKHFLARKRYPVAVNLSNKDLKKEIDSALSQCVCMLSGRGSTVMVTAGHTEMTQVQLVDNTVAVLKELAAKLPGGSGNIRNLHIKSETSPSLPLFVSLDEGDDIELEEEKMEIKEYGPDEVTTVEDGLVKVSAMGRITILPYPKEEGAESGLGEDTAGSGAEASSPAQDKALGRKRAAGKVTPGKEEVQPQTASPQKKAKKANVEVKSEPEDIDTEPQQKTQKKLTKKQKLALKSAPQVGKDTSASEGDKIISKKTKATPKSNSKAHTKKDSPKQKVGKAAGKSAMTKKKRKASL